MFDGLRDGREHPGGSPRAADPHPEATRGRGKGCVHGSGRASLLLAVFALDGRGVQRRQQHDRHGSSGSDQRRRDLHQRHQGGCRARHRRSRRQRLQRPREGGAGQGDRRRGRSARRTRSSIESNSEGTNLDENVQSLAEAGYDLIIGTGFAFTTTARSTRSRPTTPTRISRSWTGTRRHAASAGGLRPREPRRAPSPTCVDLTFTEQEGSFLVGVAAALKAQELNCDNARVPRRSDRVPDREVRGRVPRRASRRSTRT